MEDKNEISSNSESLSDMDIKPITEFDKSKYPGLLDEVIRVEQEAWPPEWRATRDKFKSRLLVFPEGFFVAFGNKKMAGVSTSEIVNYDPDHLPSTWDEITDNGYIKKTHDPRANALYVVSVGVSKNFQGQGIGRGLMEEQKNLTKKFHLRYLFLGARIPKYHEYHASHPEASAEGYVELGNDEGKRLDPELRFYESCGLKTMKVVPDYGPDPESEDYGVVMFWENPQYRQ